jgi:hypothetical protein
VVITGFTEDWRSEPSLWNWVRIYNPFTNATEYYPWASFHEAWRKTYGQYWAVFLGRKPE